MEILVRASGMWVPRDGEPVAAMDGMNMAGDKVNEPLGLRLALGRCDEEGRILPRIGKRGTHR